jgi:hypothetical protein
MEAQVDQKSVEQRVAVAMGAIEPEPAPTPEPEAPAEAAPTQDAPQTQESTETPPNDYEVVDWDGDQYEIPKKLKDALMREKDYTEKTTALSQTRQAIEAQHKELALFRERQKFEKAMGEHVETLRMIDAYTQHVETQTDWSKLGTDAIVRARVELDQLRARRQQLQQYLEQEGKKFSAQETAEREKLRRESQEALSKQIPKWSDESRTSVEAYVKGLGYPEVALPHMSQLDYTVAYKAMMYDKLQGDRGKVAEKVAVAKSGKPVIATARKVMSSDTAKYLNFRKAVAKAPDQLTRNKLVEERIGDKFNKLLGG